jgi:hypothetical protein
LQDIELARVSQEVTERFYNLLAVGESAHSPDGREADARLRIRANSSARRRSSLGNTVTCLPK